MKNLGFRSKILLPTAALFAVIIIAALAVAIYSFRDMAEHLIEYQLESASNGLRGISNELRMEAIDRGMHVAANPQLAEAVLAGDTQALLNVMDVLMARYNISTMSVADDRPIILARSFERHRYGDPLITPRLAAALDGVVSVAYTPLVGYLMPIRAAVPIQHEREIIGIAFVGFDLASQDAVERLSQRFNADISVHIGNERVATTLLDENGNSAVGTMIDASVATNYLENQREFTDKTTVFGREYASFYMPLIDEYGNMFGSMFMGIPLAHTHAEITQVTLIVAGVSLLGLVIALVIMFFLTGKLTRPIKRLADLVTNVSHGNLNINPDHSAISNDEIGTLTRDVHGLVDVIRNIVDDLDNAYTEYVNKGNMHYTINEDRYENSFKQVVGLINKLLVQTTADIESMADSLDLIGKGDFRSSLVVEDWQGDWAAVPRTFNNLTDNLNAVNTEINAMIDAVANKGDLDFHIDVDKYEGSWKDVMVGLNNIVEAVAEPLHCITIALGEMEAGHFDIDNLTKKVKEKGFDANTEKFKGEFQAATTAIEVTITTISSYINEIALDLIAISRGDLTTEITREYVGDFTSIKESLNSISQTLNKTMSEISSASEQVQAATKQIAISAQELASSAQEQSDSVEQLTATVDVVSRQTHENAENAANASEISGKSTTTAHEGNESMKEMVTAMSQIKDSSGEISKIIKAIQDIAFQTNLLALNAAVEAARAGDAGRGFSVVAEEVRSLAGRSQESATETTSLIETSNNRVESGASIVKTTSQSLDMIVKNASEVSELVHNISVASREQADAISQISEGITQISRVTQSNSAVSVETAAAAEELNSQAELLRELVAYFTL